MQLYYYDNIQDQSTITLDTNTSKHLIQVLRMKEGNQVLMTDGKGKHATATITVADKWNTQVQFSNVVEEVKENADLTIAVSFTKNKSRNEWMLEKLVEIGVHKIQPIITQRTEKERFNMERCITILQSAMLQSKQYFMPIMEEPIALKKIDWSCYEQKFVAHCEDETSKKILHQCLAKNKSTLVLIGPEGDFTPDEIEFILNNGPCTAVSLGSNRLRTETAAIYAATIFNALNEK